MLDLRLLHQALMLARHRNFARAAEALHITQPALSRSIAGLEAALGEKLFDRTGQGIEPTAFGQMLINRGERLLGDAAELERELKLMRGLAFGELRVAAGAYPIELSVARAAGQLMGRHPQLRMELSQLDLRAMVDAVLARRVDLVVMELSMVDAEPRLALEALPTHPVVFFCRAGHPLMTAGTVSFEQMLAWPFAGTRLPGRVAARFSAIAKVGVLDPDSGDYIPPVKVDSLRAARDVVLSSNAVAAAPPPLIAADVAAGRLAVLPVRLPWMHLNYGFAFLRERALSPAALAFMAEVRQVEAELAAREAGVGVADDGDGRAPDRLESARSANA
ncbi:MAG: LysR family transcriptional regulator [Burkholderiaceae bacterium]|jgi:DNA-binding transcriptional LysR family regulator|nr:LysR family transcriptional regulator [Burkholderiaceae bacterium]